MNDRKFIFRKTHDVDKEVFATLLLAAKGGRTMKDFAETCGVNPSTFTRIIQKTNKGASSPELLEAIAENSDPKSNVTLDALAHANGYTLEKDKGIKATKIVNNTKNMESLIRDILVTAIIDRGYSVRMGNIRYDFSSSLSLSPDALIMTEAFGIDRQIWFVDSILSTPMTTRNNDYVINKSKVKQMAFNKIARFVFIAMNNIDLFRPSRFSLVVTDREMYNIIVNEFKDTVVSTDISVIYIDTLNNCIIDEYALPHFEKGYRDSYFMASLPIQKNTDYLNVDYDEEDFE